MIEEEKGAGDSIGVAQQTNEGSADPQYSQEFLDKMESTKRALEGMSGGQTYSGGNPQSSSFDLENAKNQQSQTMESENTQPTIENQPATEPPAPVQGENVEKPTEEPKENTMDGQIQKITSEMTGEYTFEDQRTPEEGVPAKNGFDNFEEFQKFLSEADYGVTADNIREELPKLVEDRKEKEKALGEVDNFKTVFENMPAEIFTAIDAWSKGEDYRNVMASQANALSFEKEFEDHDAKIMVEKYFEGKIQNDEWDEFYDKDGDPDIKEKVEKYIDSSKDLYGADKQKYSVQKDAMELKAQENLKIVQASFDESRANFPKRFEGKLPIQESYIKEVDKVIKSKDSVLAMFYNPDGTVKPDAHAKIAMAMGGEELVLKQAEILKSRLVSEARQEVLQATPDSHEIKRSAESEKMSDLQLKQEEARRKAEDIMGKQKQRTYS